MILTSCGQRGTSFKALLNRVNKIADTHEHPYYYVNGAIDINGRILEINEEDGTFEAMPNGYSYVENARYYEGFYCAKAERMQMGGVSDYEESEIVIHAMASRSYWLRMPLRLHQDNFYKKRNGEINRSCGWGNLKYLITAWADSYGSVNSSSNQPYFELLSNGGFAIGGDNVRTKIYIDNYPYYMSYERHPELKTWDDVNKVWISWDEDDPLPCYSYNGDGFIDGRFNIRFVYDKNGWLKSEYLETSDYDSTQTKKDQVALKSTYKYRFS